MIVFLYQHFKFPSEGGGTRPYENIMRYAQRTNHEVIVISGGKKKGNVTQRGLNFKVIYTGTAYDNGQSFFQRIYAFLHYLVIATFLLFYYKPKLVFASSTPLTIGIPALVFNYFKSTPFIFEVRDMWPDVPIALGVIQNRYLIKLLLWLESTIYEKATEIIAVAPGMKKKILLKGVQKEKVHVVPNAVDFLAQTRNCEKYNDEKNIVHLAFVGTFGAANNPIFLIDVMKELLKLGDNYKLTTAGTGKLKGAFLETLAQNPYVATKVNIMEHIDKQSVFELLEKSEFAFSLFDGPKVLFEDAVQNKFFDSMGAGCITISNFIGFQSRLAERHETGLIVKSDLPKEAAEKIHAIAVDLVTLRRMQENAISIAKLLTRDKMFERLWKVMRQYETI